MAAAHAGGWVRWASDAAAAAAADDTDSPFTERADPQLLDGDVDIDGGAQDPKLAALADQISQLNLLETAELCEILLVSVVSLCCVVWLCGVSRLATPPCCLCG